RTAGGASALVLAERRCREPGDLVTRHVAQVLVDGPAVPERVNELAGAVAPERVVQRLEYLGARVDGALPGRVGVLHGQVQRAVGAAQGQRRDDAHVRELVGDRQPAVAEGQLDGHYLAAGQRDPAFFRRVQDRLIPGGGCFW